MVSYCINCKKNTENINSRDSNTSNGKEMVKQYVAKKISRFIKNQEAREILSNLRLEILLNKIPLLGYILF